jgi:hypothetical protein
LRNKQVPPKASNVIRPAKAASKPLTVEVKKLTEDLSEWQIIQPKERPIKEEPLKVPKLKNRFGQLKEQ